MYRQNHCGLMSGVLVAFAKDPMACDLSAFLIKTLSFELEMWPCLQTNIFETENVFTNNSMKAFIRFLELLIYIEQYFE